MEGELLKNKSVGDNDDSEGKQPHEKTGLQTVGVKG